MSPGRKQAFISSLTDLGVRELSIHKPLGTKSISFFEIFAGRQTVMMIVSVLSKSGLAVLVDVL